MCFKPDALQPASVKIMQHSQNINPLLMTACHKSASSILHQFNTSINLVHLEFYKHFDVLLQCATNLSQLKKSL